MSGKAISSLLFFSAFSLLFFSFVTKPAYADVLLTYGTFSGGTFDATDDLAFLSSANDVLWVTMNSATLVAVDNDTYAVLDEETVSQSGSVLASLTGTSVLFFGITTNTILKYTLSGGVIVQTGSWTPPAGCTGFDITVNDFNYDETGYLWLACPTSDTIVKFNPSTMTTVFNSNDLTDAVGIDCNLVANSIPVYSQADNIGVVNCDGAPDTIVSFSISGSTITLIDSENANSVVTSGAHFINGFNNRGYLVTDSNTVYTYDAAGALTLGTFPTSTSYDGCQSEPILSADVFLLCVSDGGGDITIDAFLSDENGLTQILNTVTTNGMASGRYVGLDVGESTFYGDDWTNSLKVFKITGFTRGTTGPDVPPSGSDGGSCVATPPAVCVDTDGDGIGDLLVPDTDGDGVPDFPPSSFPPVTGGADAADRLANLIRVMSGLDLSTSKLVIAAVIHLLMIGTVAFFSMESKHPMPMIVYAAVIIIAGGISFVAGFMDGLIFMAETVMIVGGFAFIMSRGVR